MEDEACGQSGLEGLKFGLGGHHLNDVEGGRERMEKDTSTVGTFGNSPVQVHGIRPCTIGVYQCG